MPLLERFEDITIDFRTDEGDGYTCRMAANDSPELRERIRNALHQLDASGAVLGVVPEVTLTDPLLDLWKSLLRETADGTQELRWVLVGTGPLGGHEPPVNRAVLLDRWSGETLLTQDKLTQFSISRRQLEDWRIRIRRPAPRCGNRRRRVTRSLCWTPRWGE